MERRGQITLEMVEECQDDSSLFMISNKMKRSSMMQQVSVACGMRSGQNECYLREKLFLTCEKVE